MKCWFKCWGALIEVCSANDEDQQPKQPDDIILINQARDELLAARHMFAEMEDPDMVDWAVYNISAAEKRYNYLIKTYRRKKQVELASELSSKGLERV